MKVGDVDTNGVDRESRDDEGASLTGASNGKGGKRGYDTLGGSGGGGGGGPRPPNWFWAGLLVLGLVAVIILATSSSSDTCPVEEPEPDYVHFQQMFTDPDWEGAMRPEAIKQNLDDLTFRPHVAGTPDDLRTAEYVRDRVREMGWDADLVEYEVLLMYPKTDDPAGPYAELSATFPNGRTFTAALEERVYPEDPLSASGTLPFPTFNGYSPSTPEEGLTAPVVYANYGTREDFETVAAAGVDVRGCICIVRYGANFRGSKTENANNAGCIGVLIYSDPRDYAKEGVEPENTFPNTRYLPETGVQRGSLFAAAGDPLTPGWAATSDALRLDPEDPEQYIDEGECPNPGGCTVWGTERLLPSIPTHPISYGDAGPILSNLGGVLVPPQDAGSIPGVTYRYGIPEGAGAVTATLKIRANFVRTPIWNVVTVIPGAIDPEHVRTSNLTRHSARSFSRSPLPNSTVRYCSTCVLCPCIVLDGVGCDPGQPSRCVGCGCSRPVLWHCGCPRDGAGACDAARRRLETAPHHRVVLLGCGGVHAAGIDRMGGAARPPATQPGGQLHQS